MTVIRAFFPKIRALFSKFRKRAGETSPLSPLVTRMSEVLFPEDLSTFFESFRTRKVCSLFSENVSFLSMFLNFCQNSGLCSYKIVSIKKSVN